MNKHSVALILPYFGQFPNYFPLWLKSAGANENFTFMIFTDIDMSGYNIPQNVQVHYLTFDGLKKLIAPHLDFEFVLDTPYKLCDYKPMYGLIFKDWLDGYDFWGFCDCDIILGNINKYITDDLLDRYGRLYQHGHFQLFRNTEDVKHFVLHKLPNWNISYRDIYRVSEYVGLDEFAMPERLFSEYTYGVGGEYYANNFADIVPNPKEFKRFTGDKIIPAFRWKDGKVFALAVGGDPELDVEYMYLHIQKRPMKFTPGIEKEDSFMIIPNEFVKDHELIPEEIHALMTPRTNTNSNFTDVGGGSSRC